MSLHLFVRVVLIIILLVQLAGIGVFGWAIFTAGKQKIVDHFVRYARSYLVGAIFVALSLLSSFVAEFEHIAKADRLGWDYFDWCLHLASAGANALTTILAFLNQTNSTDKQKPTPDAKETPPDPVQSLPPGHL